MVQMKISMKGSKRTFIVESIEANRDGFVLECHEDGKDPECAEIFFFRGRTLEEALFNGVSIAHRSGHGDPG